MAVEGAASSPREADISPRDRSPARWDEEDDEQQEQHQPPAQAYSGGMDTPPRHEDAPRYDDNESRPSSRNERRRSYDDEERGSTSLLIRHLKFTTAPSVVRAFFETVGPVKDVYLPLEFETGKPRGFGFVEFQHAADAKEALRSLNDTDLDGSCISISVAQHGRKTPSLMRARSSGGSGGYGRRRGGYDSRRRGEPYSAPDRYERSPRGRYDDERPPRYDRYSSSNGNGESRSGGPPRRNYDRDREYYHRDGSPSRDYDSRRRY